MEEKIDLKRYSEIVGDKYTLKILAATFITEKSSHQLSIECDIPIAACYRRVNMLEKIGLLKCVGRPVTQRGKRVKVYQSCVRDLSINFEGWKMRVKVDLKSVGKPVESAWNVIDGKDIHIRKVD
jgi:hypothetical protein